MKQEIIQADNRTRDGLTTPEFTAVSETEYKAADGSTLKREYGKTPNGNDMNGRWVLRNPEGKFLTFDQYRSDIAEEYSLKLIPLKT